MLAHATTTDHDRARLEEALSHGLNLPVSALRVSMQALEQELSRANPARPHLQGALEEVERLGRNVRDLMEYATPPRLQPMPCSLDEVVHCARVRIVEEQRGKIFFARSPEKERALCDGPILSRCLARLIENALEAKAQRVLVAARRDGAQTRITVVDDAPDDFDPSTSTRPFHSTKGNHLGLGLSIVERDMQLMHGSLSLSRTETGKTFAALVVPDGTVQEASA